MVDALVVIPFLVGHVRQAHGSEEPEDEENPHHQIIDFAVEENRDFDEQEEEGAKQNQSRNDLHEQKPWDIAAPA